MAVSFDQRLIVPDNVMFRVLEGESVILDLDSESYFGLDEVGTRMWEAVTEADTVGDGFTVLAGEFDVGDAELRADLEEFLSSLVDNGLLEVADG